MMKLANLTATTAIGKEAVFLVSKSAETFLQMLTEQSVHFARAGKRKKVRTGGSPSERARALHVLCTCMHMSYAAAHGGPGAP